MGLTGTYNLIDNIDCSAINFQPIGSMTSPFTGTLNGNGKIITGLRENSNCGYPGCAMGLFGKIQNANINKVGLKNVKIVNTGSPSVYAGALAGISMSSSISRCFSIGTISLPYGFPYHNVGGGLVGLSGSSKILNSYSQVNITSGGGCWLGGFIGETDGTQITHCYSTGSITHSDRWGGFIGFGGGSNSIDNCYWDIKTSGASTSDGGTGMPHVSMYKQIKFVNWDFSTIWKIKEGLDYPRLLWECDPVANCAGKVCGDDLCGNPNGCGSCSGLNPICNLGACVQCITKTDCGIDQFIGTSYCKIGDITNVYRNKTEYSCLGSVCSSSINERIYQTCNVNEICSNGICVLNYVGSVNWTDMINKPITNADLNDRVKLLVIGVGLYGKNFNFTIYKKSITGDIEVFEIKNVIGQSYTNAYTTWIANLTGDYYYKTEAFDGIHSSGILHVSTSEMNSAPVAKIENPKKGEIYYKELNVSFNQSSFDTDDYINYTWNLDDLKTYKGSTENYINYNLTDSYSSEGQKNINLSVIDERGLTDQDHTSILIIDSGPEGNGKKYVFAGISKPLFGESLSMIGNVEFDANDSYAIEVTTIPSVSIKCLGGKCPGSVPVNANTGNFSIFNFSWRFDDGSESGKISGNTKYSKGFPTGDHYAVLEVTLDSGEKSSTIVIFKYTGGVPENCQEGGTKWVDTLTGVSYSTAEANGKCLGNDHLPETSDDCCPKDGHTCQGGLSDANCTLSADCIPIPPCSNYTDSSSCVADKCGAAQRGCSSSTGGGIKCAGFSSSGAVVGGSCNCYWDGSACKLNISASTNIGDINIKGTGLVDSYTHGECSEGQMVVTQHCIKSWENISVIINKIPGVDTYDKALAWANKSCEISGCFSGTKMVVCDDTSIRLGFFNWINAFVVVILIAIIYFILFLSKKKTKR